MTNEPTFFRTILSSVRFPVKNLVMDNCVPALANALNSIRYKKYKFLSHFCPSPLVVSGLNLFWNSFKLGPQTGPLGAFIMDDPHTAFVSVELKKKKIQLTFNSLRKNNYIQHSSREKCNIKYNYTPDSKYLAAKCMLMLAWRPDTALKKVRFSRHIPDIT